MYTLIISSPAAFCFVSLVWVIWRLVSHKKIRTNDYLVSTLSITGVVAVFSMLGSLPLDVVEKEISGEKIVKTIPIYSFDENEAYRQSTDGYIIMAGFIGFVNLSSKREPTYRYRILTERGYHDEFVSENHDREIYRMPADGNYRIEIRQKFEGTRQDAVPGTKWKFGQKAKEDIAFKGPEYWTFYIPKRDVIMFDGQQQ